MIEGIQISKLKVIPAEGGPVRHALKSTDSAYEGFGEAYFSTIKKGAVKKWRKHSISTSNLIVPKGSVNFFFYDDRPGISSSAHDQRIQLSETDYQRLTIPPGIWFSMQNSGTEDALVLNISNQVHDPAESETADFQDERFLSAFNR